jgi:hypothetical protein
MLITAALALALTPLRPLRIGAATSLSRAAALSCKLSRTGGNKQQDLADMMARAKALREGVAPPEPLKPSAQSSKPAKAKAPKASTAPKPAVVTRDQMFADFQNVKMQKAEQTAKSQLSRYGQEKPRAREARAPEQQAERPDPSMGGASKPAPPTAEEYAKFGQLLGSGAGARGPVRAVSDEVLTRGDQLPLPARGLAELDGVPSGFGSLEALAGEQGVLVLLASVDTLLGERWRSTLSAFHGQADFAALGARVAAVSRVPTNAYRKLSRKAGVAYPLLSDPQSMWLGPLRCETGSVLAFVVDPGEARVIASFRGSEPLELLRRVKAKVQEHKDGGVEAAGAAEEAAPEEETAEEEEVSDAAALDEMAAMWADAEGDSLSAAEAAWGLGAEEETAAAEAAALQVGSTQQSPSPSPDPSPGPGPDPRPPSTARHRAPPRAHAPRAPSRTSPGGERGAAAGARRGQASAARPASAAHGGGGRGGGGAGRGGAGQPGAGGGAARRERGAGASAQGGGGARGGGARGGAGGPRGGGALRARGRQPGGGHCGGGAAAVAQGVQDGRRCGDAAGGAAGAARRRQGRPAQGGGGAARGGGGGGGAAGGAASGGAGRHRGGGGGADGGGGGA